MDLLEGTVCRGEECEGGPVRGDCMRGLGQGPGAAH